MIKNNWISVKDRLPEIDDYVLWIRENGSIFQECIDKDWDKEYLDYFLSGGKLKEIAGPVIYWMPSPPYPEAKK